MRSIDPQSAFRNPQSVAGGTVHRLRVALVFVVLTASLAVLLGRLFTLQIRDHRGLAERASRQYRRLVPLTSKRGTITDRNGRELAVSLQAPSVFAQPSAVADAEGAAAALAAHLPLSRTQLLERLHADKPFVWLARQVEPAQAEAVARLNLKGIGLVAESRRLYPRQELAAHLLGFVGVDDRGLEGIEFQYDALLGGKPRWVVAAQDALGRVVFRDEAEPTDRETFDVVLTIDEVIQYITERELERAVARSRARAGTAIVMDPRTGEVLALANWPTFNPNLYQQAPADDRRDRAAVDTFEPGSVFKVILGAAALEEGVVHLGDRFYGENGAIEVGGVTIRDHERYAWLTFEDVLAQSSNVGAIKVGLRLGKTLYYNYISGFGFGSLTGIDLPGETPGLIRRPQKWSQVSLGALSIGQEVSVTPLQLLTAFAAVANGGELVRPFVARALRRQDAETVRTFGPLKLRRVISAATVRALAVPLQAVVREGTGKEAAVDGYSVMGKTGTAQKLDRATGRYSHRKVVASFVGAVPVEDPRLAILVVIDEPQAHAWGGAIAAPTFREIARETLKYLRVPPSPPAERRVASAAQGAGVYHIAYATRGPR
ncbi:MAG TPA: penicillin-binding protein 2 [Candidatus Sulfotelmatobacter sp.]|nr:penicillin-binding protein 2 [Candidatus Sulfotelmatobacter sp.]